MGQLNYDACNTGVVFSNGFAAGFGFFLSFFFFPPEENHLFCGKSPSFSLLHPDRHNWKAVLLWE